MVKGILRRGAGLLLRPANPLAPIAESAAGAKRGIGHIADAARSTLARPMPPPDADRLGRIADHQARFSVAIEERGVSEGDLAGIEAGLRRRLNVWLLLFALAVAYAFASPRAGLLGVSPIPALDRALPWLFASWLACRTALASLKLRQVQLRALIPFSEWVRDPGAWLGGNLAMSVGAAIVSLWTGSPGAALGAPGDPPTAAAASITGVVAAAVSATHANDLSLEWLRRMFPGVSINGSAPSASDTLAPLFTMFNSTLFFFGTLVLIWQTISALVHAAHTGEGMGRNSKYHATWAPIRLVVGAGALIPVKGYCMAQLALIALLSGGYMFTNGMWALYVDTMLSPQSSSTIVAPRLDPGRNLAAQILQAETCAQTMGGYQPSAGFWDTVSLGMFRSSRPPTSLPPTAGTRAGPATVWDYGQVCGTLKLDAVQAAAASSTGAGVAAASPDTSARTAAYQTFDSARIAALGALVGAARDSRLAETIRDRVTPNYSTSGPPAAQAAANLQKVLTAAAAYTDELNRAAKEMSATLDADGRKEFKRTATDLGWASAGALNFTLTRISAGVMARAASGMPEIAAPSPERVSGEGQQRLRSAFGALSELLVDARERDYVTREGIYVAENRSSSNPISWLLKEPSHWIANGIQNAAELDAVNPMASMVNLGNTVLLAGEGMFISWVSANVVANSADATASNLGVFGTLGRPFTAGGKALMDVVAPWMVMFIGALLAFGALHAYVLPMVPFIMWFFAVISCAVFAYEAVIAMPLAALAHMRIDGDEMVGQSQRPFWILAFNAALRPPLLLFGLIGSNILFAVMAGYLNRTFALAMLSSMGDSIIGFVGQLVMLGLLLFLHYQIAVRCMALVHQVPAMVSRLLGADDGERGERDGTSTVIGAAASFTRNTGSAALRVGASAGGKRGGPGGDEAGAGTGAAVGAAAGISKVPDPKGKAG